MAPERDVVVVGAGVAGLTAARELRRQGRRVTVLDKGRSVGGRLATRRIGDARLDHGAQFFTQRGPDMAQLVDQLVGAGLLDVWCFGFAGPDGHARHTIRGGMNGLARYLADDLDDVRTGVTVTAVEHGRSGWVAHWDGGRVTAAAALLTAPVPQSLALLDAGGTRADAGIRPALDEVTYDPALAVLVVLDGPSSLVPPGAAQPTEGPFAFVADNHLKGISERPALTLHATPRWSERHWHLDDDRVLALALEAALPWIGSSGVVAAQLKRWRYASPRRCWPEPCCVAVDGDEPLVLAGDAFEAPRVEGAFHSGLAAATAVLRAHLADAV